MKLLMVSHGLPPSHLGGAEIIVQRLAAEFSRKHEVSIFSARLTQEMEREDGILICRKDGDVEVSEICRSHRRKKTPFSKRLHLPDIEKYFSEIIENWQPDLIHFHHLHHLSIMLPAIAKRSRIPLLLTLHDYWFICPRIHLLDPGGKLCNPDLFDSGLGCLQCVIAERIERFSPAASRVSLKVPRKLYSRILSAAFQGNGGVQHAGGESYPGSEYRFQDGGLLSEIGSLSMRFHLMRSALSTVHNLVFPSREALEIYDSFIERVGERFVSENGVDSVSVAEPRTGNIVRFGFIGTVSFHKGVHLMIEAARILQNTGAFRGKWEFIIYGRCDNRRYLKACTKMASGLPVRFEGQFRRDELSDVLGSFDVIVVPSIWPETYGNSPREALRGGIPAIVSRIGALPRCVSDGKNGFVFEPGNAGDLAEKMIEFIKNPQFLGESRRYARETSLRTIEDQAAEHEDVYMRILKRARDK